MTDVLVTPAFVPLQADTGDTTKFGPNAWKAPRLFSAGNQRDVLIRDPLAATGAAWVHPAVAVTAADLGLSLVTNVALPAAYTIGDLIYASGVGTLSKLGIGAAGTVLIGGATPAWSASPALTGLTLGTALTPGNGGTGLASYAVGDLLYASGATTLSKRAAVAVGQVLVSAGVTTAPVWSASPTLTNVTASGYVSSPALYFQSRTLLTSPLDAQLSLSNNAGASGVGLDFTTTAVLKIRTLAQSADATVQALAYTFGGDNAGDVGAVATRARNVFAVQVTTGYITGNTTDGVQLQIGSNTKWRVNNIAPFEFYPQTDNTYDLGATASRVRTGYFGTALVVGTNPSTTGALRFQHVAQVNGRDSTNVTNVILMDWGTVADTLTLGQAGFDSVINGKIALMPGSNDIKWGKALVALGGGSAPTLGTIGGSGPATAAQNTWLRVLDSTGAACWVPVWK